jgi:hypothetical protein
VKWLRAAFLLLLALNQSDRCGAIASTAISSRGDLYRDDLGPIVDTSTSSAIREMRFRSFFSIRNLEKFDLRVPPPKSFASR